MPHLDVRYDSVTMDIRQAVRPDGLIAAGHMLITGFVLILCLGLFVLLIVPIDGFGYVDVLIVCFVGLYALFLFVFNLSIPFVNTLLNRAPPIRLNRQRREVAFVVAPSRRLWLPAPENLWFMGLGLLAMSFFSGPIAFFYISQWLVGAEERFPLGLVLFHGIAMALLFGYSTIYDFIAHFFKRERRTVLVPWEDIVAIVGVSSSLAWKEVFNFGWSLTLLIPDQERPGYSLPGAGIIASADGVREALAQWEYIRRFMEDGADAITPSAREWGVEWYNAYVAREKAECERTNDMARWRRFRRKRIWEHARFAHWYTEYRMKHILPKAVPSDWLAEWSKPLPESQWAKPSAAVNELSEHLRAAYQRGEKFIEMGDIEKRFGVAVPAASQQAYPTFPFRANARLA
nr:hypothetical protein [Halomonas sp.]